jgi:FlaA1/EpsC-like NDP-sugar epimerase
MLNKEICLFGAGDYGQSALKHYGSERVAFFVDNDPDKAGTECCGKKVLGFGEFQSLSDGYSLIVSNKYYPQIKTSTIIREKGHDNKSVCHAGIFRYG